MFSLSYIVVRATTVVVQEVREVAKAKPTSAEGDNSGGKSIQIMEVEWGHITYFILGKTPLVYNQVSEKARRQLVFPSGRKTKADKETNLKHDPVSEYRDSVYMYDREDKPTRLYLPTTMFKAAMGVAALYTSGARKIEVSRALWVEDEDTPVFGTPYMFMCPVKPINAAMDIRTRAILPYWACKITVSHPKRFLNATSTTNLLAAAGIFAGVGDFRPERGKGSYGTFSLVGPDHPKFAELVDNEGKQAQDDGLEVATAYDKGTRDILKWFTAEASRKGKDVPSSSSEDRGKRPPTLKR